jgi:hypothetical protein
MLRHGSSQNFGKAQGQQENRSGSETHPGFLPFALSVIVPNNCEHRNNLSLVHRLLMHIAKKKKHFRVAVWAFTLMCCLPNRIIAEWMGMQYERRRTFRFRQGRERAAAVFVRLFTSIRCTSLDYCKFLTEWVTVIPCTFIASLPFCWLWARLPRRNLL